MRGGQEVSAVVERRERGKKRGDALGDVDLPASVLEGSDLVRSISTCSRFRRTVSTRRKD